MKTIPDFLSSERRGTGPITLPAPPAMPVVIDDVSELRQEIAGMHVHRPPTWQQEAAALGHRAENLAKRHPGTAIAIVFGLGMVVGTICLLLSRHRETPKERARRGLAELGASLHDLIVPAASRAVRDSRDAAVHGLHRASKGLDAVAARLGRTRG